MPIHACPSYSSSSNPLGIFSRSTSAATGQCANSRSFQVCVITHGEEGIGHGRWSVILRMSWLKEVIPKAGFQRSRQRLSNRKYHARKVELPGNRVDDVDLAGI